MLLKSIVIIICLTMVSSEFVGSQGTLEVKKFDSKQLNEAWNNYLNYPSTENALTIYKILPVFHMPRIDDSSQMSNPEFIDEFIMMLERQVRTSDRNAVKVAFRFFNISDGYLSESLDMVLGELIRINPKLFLEELHNHKNIELSLGHLLGNYGTEYVDRFDACQLETSLRINALNTIQIDSLVYLRDSCIAILKE